VIEQQHGDLRYLQFDHYLQFPELIHGVFTRRGGYSKPPYQGLNISTPPRNEHRDSVDHVVRNRYLALQTLDIAHYPCVTLWQVHGADVLSVDDQSEWRTDWACHSYYEHPWTPQTIRKGDALITRQRGFGIAFSFADCVPITFYDPVEHVSGIAHGGWRGTARGIVLATVEAMRECYGCLPENIRAGIGPAIGACCYEVSEEVRAYFEGTYHFEEMPARKQYRDLIRTSAIFSTLQLPERESLRLDLGETNRRQLLMAGIKEEHIEVADICTCCHTELFFSHRGEQGRTGRFAVIMALRN
jgi:YfiH family protein